ncbi:MULTISPECIES: hypothetical protein [Novosphingobium]|uniref:hypothetical protein n=1 Tax=Novosphingobium sp. TCA1 TaxID=2682474 RepID=UPI0010568BA0|nr:MULTISPECIES: hypothetical protein [Novosphingobium]
MTNVTVNVTIVTNVIAASPNRSGERPGFLSGHGGPAFLQVFPQGHTSLLARALNDAFATGPADPSRDKVSHRHRLETIPTRREGRAPGRKAPCECRRLEDHDTVMKGRDHSGQRVGPIVRK